MSGRDARIPRVERRTFLVLGAAAVGLAGCTSDTSEPGPPSAQATTAAPSDPDARIREEVAASEVALIAAYRSAIGANPDLAADLEPFLAQHEAHLARVAPGFVSDVGTPVASTSPSASGPPIGEPSAAGDPGTSPSDSLGAGTSPSGSRGAGTASSGSIDAGTSPSGSPDAGTSPSGSPDAGTASSGSPKPGASSVVAELAAAESAAQAQRATACHGAQDPGLARDLCLIAASEAQHAAALDDLGERRAGS
jgi:hypothetical protein